ncbi:hypothetical protein E2C01_056817 [Portunus trituberculatus]|uniref:Uncharacterized protein n=1 Tax=Portunus trituberculatus TaxID=210409 RepID=A0A5B7H064_PORTR|nr:hypothetical protein [Portunus trituberculatus]
MNMKMCHGTQGFKLASLSIIVISCVKSLNISRKRQRRKQQCLCNHKLLNFLLSCA